MKPTTIELTHEGETLTLRTPFNPAFGPALRRHEAGARWRPDAKVWTAPAGRKAAVWKALVDVFAGARLRTARGESAIPSRAERRAAAEGPCEAARQALSAAVACQAELALAYERAAGWQGNSDAVAGYPEPGAEEAA